MPWLIIVLALLGACVDLTPPRVTECAESEACPSDAGATDSGDETPPDAGDTDSAPTDASPFDSSTPDTLTPDSSSPDQALDSSPDLAADSPVDAPVDRAPDFALDSQPDLAPDGPADAAVDRSPDLAPDLAPDSGTAICPAGDPSLLICLRFENSLIDESDPRAVLTSTNLSYVSEPSGVAGRMAATSQLRASTGWGSIGDRFTLEASIRPDRMPTGSQRAGIMDEEGAFGLFLLPGGEVNCSASGADTFASNAVMVGQWTAVACTAGADSLTLWINGVARDQDQMDGASNGATGTLGIGGNLPSGDPFEGSIDNVRVWNSTRTQQQICAQAPGCQ